MTTVPKTLDEVVALLMRVVEYVEKDDDRGARLEEAVGELTEDVRTLEDQVVSIESRLADLEADGRA